MGMDYKVSYAACTGRHHSAAGLPCQDKVALVRGGGAFCAALADGAGSRTDSDLGADCVTRCAAGLLAREFDRLWTLGDDLAGYLTDACIQALAQLEPPIYEMACTLLFFAGHEDGRYLSGHLGDGFQILVKEKTASVFSPPENGEYQNETFFITALDAQEHLRVRRGRLEGEGVLLLMSDGMGEALYQRNTGQPAPACATVAGWLQGDGDEDTISRALESNLREISRKRSGDDLSLAVIAWRPDGGRASTQRE